jgi:hypothetical protein
MIDAFVLAELESSRHGGFYRGLVDGDLSRYRGDGELARALRRVALYLVRGYGRSAYLFAGFPDDATWKLVALPVGELRDWLYAHEQTWLALSKHARRVRVGARNVGKVPSIQETSACILAVETDVRNGRRASSYTPIIAAAVDEDSPHVIAEGHTRATAFVRALQPQDEVEVIVGYSPHVTSWQYFRLP